MPAVRPTARLLAAAVFLASVLSLPPPRVVRACPVSPPVPLRMLYKSSDRVVVAEVGDTTSELRRQPETDSKVITLTTTFRVSEGLKGDPSETTLRVQEWGGYEGYVAPSRFKKGSRLLLFLSGAGEPGLYRVNDARYGVKELSQDHLKVYIKRIEELAAILRQEKPDSGEILEWLVRCAEEKATRWEGAYELLSSMDAQAAESGSAAEQEQEAEADEVSDEESEEAASEEADEAGADVESAEASAGAEEPAQAEQSENTAAEGASGEAPPVAMLPGEILARTRVANWGTDIEAGAALKLTKEQRERLLSALFSADEIESGELVLVELFKDSGDARLVPFLVRHLNRMEADPPYAAEQLVSALASALKDKALVKAAEYYSANAPYSEYVEEEEEESDEEYVEDEEESEAAGSASKPEAVNKERVKGAQRRSEMLRAFLAAADNRIQQDLVMQLSR